MHITLLEAVIERCYLKMQDLYFASAVKIT